MKISLITTVFNEAKTIKPLLESIVSQTRLPDEMIIVDGSSTDSTLQLIEAFITENQRQTSKLKWRVFSKPGSISVGRNLAISKSKYDWIAVTDAGCVLDKDWLKELELAATSKQATKSKLKHPPVPDVIAGYYQGRAANAFEEAVIPYVLVMPDQLDPSYFLPATRSVMFKKKVWRELGGFDEQLGFSEDHVFFRKARDKGFSFITTTKALVKWLPRSSLGAFVSMIYKTARYDVEAGVIRPKVILIFGRYLLGLLLISFMAPVVSFTTGGMALLLMLIYSVWSISKNYRYVPNGWYWLPILQVTSDIAVMVGSLQGIRHKQV